MYAAWTDSQHVPGQQKMLISLGESELLTRAAVIEVMNMATAEVVLTYSPLG